MAFGYNAWDANGVPNNYGIKPVSVTGFFFIDVNQKSGQWEFSIPQGRNMSFFFVGNGTSQDHHVGALLNRET
ncbi:hypothetical protein [Klebsiella pneumoniae]|uniref:hypothetical protein n=1 Tax=Klebsiella pneumoniae TaxID=573 RepID=UPI0010FF4860|nr:hypothetical protein [Klebsiella pneumoniae]